MAQLAHEGYDPAFGARPLKRVIQREIGDPAAMLILDGKVGEGDTIQVRAGVEPTDPLQITAVPPRPDATSDRFIRPDPERRVRLGPDPNEPSRLRIEGEAG